MTLLQEEIDRYINNFLYVKYLEISNRIKDEMYLENDLNKVADSRREIQEQLNKYFDLRIKSNSIKENLKEFF